MITINDGTLSEIYFEYGEMIYSKIQNKDKIKHIPFGKFMAFTCYKHHINLVNENGENLPLDLCYRYRE